MIVNITVEFNDDGTATVKLPEGKKFNMAQSKIADFTKRLAEGMGTITERHVGHHHSHLHASEGTADHVHEENK